MHKQKWYADLTQNQLGIWYLIWKFISKKTLGREAIKIMTLVNTPKGEQNSLASCSPFTDLIKSINIYNHIHIDDQYMYPVWYTQLQCYRANSGPLLMKLFRWNHQFFWSQTAPTSHPSLGSNPSRRQADVSSAGRGRILRGVTAAGHVASCVDRWLPVFTGQFRCISTKKLTIFQVHADTSTQWIQWVNPCWYLGSVPSLSCTEYTWRT